MVNSLLKKKNELCKNKKKGFTLVELIVVLVILAILLAILVPSMIKWIDKAKEKQVMLDARAAYLAAQTIISEDYGKQTPELTIPDGGGAVSGAVTGYTGDSIATQAADFAGVDGTITSIVVDEDHAVTGMVYTEDGKKATLADKNWTVTDAD